MKSIKYFILSVCLAGILLASCDSFNDATDAGKVAYVSVKIKTNLQLEGLTDFSDLKVELKNYDEGATITKPFATELTVDSIIPGIWDVFLSGRVKNNKGESFLMNGSLSREVILKDRSLEMKANSMAVTPLVFSEIYYSGSRTVKNTVWFRDQFYEIYNNSLDRIYLDGLYFATLVPTATSVKVATWPPEDGDNYVYADRVWKIPGNGTDYPLEPGESFVIAQFAANQQLDIYNPNSPVNCFSAEFEFNMNNPNFPDQPAVDMEHVFYYGKADMGTVPQYLTAVFGGAYIIFRPKEGDTYDPVNDKSMQTKDLSGNLSKNQVYAKVPISYVLDAVEAGRNEADIQRKRVPNILDIGMTYVGSTYIGQSVARKLVGTNEDGTPILEDTNNSTEDFDRNLVPQFRRYGSKMPAWNHTLLN
ncbi:MAG: DUF4876 domain-containing protein [Bacteroides sp.]|jgi:hypothetical protein|nr:DUF4876 domain-containing protein [Bacteroides sp.]MCI1683390.1 DUF4876 domain-containing protein [Bacteroides sp.]